MSGDRVPHRGQHVAEGVLAEGLPSAAGKQLTVYVKVSSVVRNQEGASSIRS